MSSASLTEAELVAKRAGLKIVTKYTGRGEVQNWRVFRPVSGALVYLGNSGTGAGLLGLVKRCARVAA